jgi:amidase
MTDIDRLYRSADGVELAALVAKGDVTPLELVEAGVRAIEEMNPALNAVIHKLYDMGRAGAAAVTPEAGPLAGVPFLLKELASSWTGAPLTNSSRFLKDQVAQGDSEISRRLRAAGLLLLGKSNAPENGWSISTEPALYGATVNPWDASVTAGGSSGGRRLPSPPAWSPWPRRAMAQGASASPPPAAGSWASSPRAAA